MNLYLLAKVQETKLDEFYYYGSEPEGNWGYLNADGTRNKCWYSMVMFGDFVRQTQEKVETSVDANLKTVATIAGLSKDGKTATLLVCDYCGKQDRFFIDVKGLGPVKRVSAVILDHTNDMAVAPVDYRDGQLVLSRTDENSAAFLVTFEL
jgi:hypothetical protein